MRDLRNSGALAPALKYPIDGNLASVTLLFARVGAYRHFYWSEYLELERGSV